MAFASPNPNPSIKVSPRKASPPVEPGPFAAASRLAGKEKKPAHARRLRALGRIRAVGHRKTPKEILDIGCNLLELLCSRCLSRRGVLAYQRRPTDATCGSAPGWEAATVGSGWIKRQSLAFACLFSGRLVSCLHALALVVRISWFAARFFVFFVPAFTLLGGSFTSVRMCIP